MKILLTGASGAMGQESLKAILAGERNFDLLLPVMDTDKDPSCVLMSQFLRFRLFMEI